MKRAAMGPLLTIILVAPGPVLGKMPWHEVEVAPTEPVAGEPLTVVVRFWDDAAHTRPSTWWPDSDHGGSLELEGPAGRVPLTLIRTGDATFRAEVTLAEGTWRLMAAQQFAEASGPTDVELATVIVAAAPSSASPTPPVPIGAAVIGLVLITVGAVWRRSRSPSPIEPD